MKDDGRMTPAILKGVGLGERESKQLRATWRERQWLRKESAKGNAHILTKSPQGVFNCKVLTQISQGSADIILALVEFDKITVTSLK